MTAVLWKINGWIGTRLLSFEGSFDLSPQEDALEFGRDGLKSFYTVEIHIFEYRVD